MPQRVEYQGTIEGQDPIFDEPSRLTRLRGGFLIRSHFTAEASARGDLMVPRGLIVAQVEGGLEENQITGAQLYYVPYSATAAYGTGSDTADGILREGVNLTQPFNRTVAPVKTGEAYTSACYAAGGAMGDISAAIKTDLTGITWRD